MNRKRATSSLSTSFNAVSAGIWVALTIAFVWTMQGQDERVIENEIGAPMESACITAKTRTPFGNPGAAPTPAQSAMTAMVARMDQTDIGRHLNQSGAKNNLIWCAGKNPDYYGAYTRGVGILNLDKFGGAETLLRDPHAANRALRTMYEENAHAWQAQTQNALRAPWDALPHHKIAWTAAAESSARVTAFTALNQHRLAGDHAVWADNLAERKNTRIMTRMQNAADPATGTFGHNALWAGFDAFYDERPLLRHYQISAGTSLLTHIGNIPVRDETISRLGTVPGIAGNYMTDRFTLDNPRYTGILDPALRERLERTYGNRNTEPLTRKLFARP